MKVAEVAKVIEQFAPLQIQESYDNAGLCIGNAGSEVKGILITIDITEDVINEAIQKNCNLILSHHPLIFSGIKKITGNSYVEKCIIKAIQNNINIYSAHTNADMVSEGVSYKMCEKLALQNLKILSPLKDQLKKLVTFAPSSYAEKVREAIFAAGAGNIGNYDNCSYNISGNGTFRGNEKANPFVGKIGELHTEEEIRIETVFPKHIQKEVISALINAHPYEEVAYDIYPLENELTIMGLGMIGELVEPVDEEEFLKKITKVFNASGIRYTKLRGKKIKKVAVCGGSGSSLLRDAISYGADVFISADFKYHQFFDANGRIVIVDIGHYESEQYTKELFYNLLVKNFPNFAVHFSDINTNPINYL